jgi:hypothetical protein
MPLRGLAYLVTASGSLGQGGLPLVIRQQQGTDRKLLKRLIFSR